MTFALRSPSARTRPLWQSTFVWLAASAACMTVAAASLPAVEWAGTAGPVAAAGPVPAVVVTAAAIPTASPRCRNCGTIETVHRVPASGASPAAYELTVRFRDGSRRRSSHSDDAGWRVGESILLIGGSQLADRL